MKTMNILALLLLLLALDASGGLPAPRAVTDQDALLSSSNGTTLVSSPSFALQGTPLRGLPANSAQDCAVACGQHSGCQWANWCGIQVRTSSPKCRVCLQGRHCRPFPPAVIAACASCMFPMLGPRPCSAGWLRRQQRQDGLPAVPAAERQLHGATPGVA